MRLRKLLTILGASVVLATTLFGGPSPGGHAQEAPPDAKAPADAWVLSGPGGPISQLFTPSSGALFAANASSLFRSDDGGATWRQITLPPSSYLVEVDPTDHTVLYAAGAEGLYKSGDDAASWTLVLPDSENVRAIVVSPADHNLIYAGLAGRGGAATDFRFLRSRDRGTTWEQLEEHHNSLCGWDVRLFEAHPTDASQLYRTAGCYAGRNLGDSLYASADQGTTWAEVFKAPAVYPARIVGGQGAVPGRFYLAANRDFRAGGSVLYRTDDGRAWSTLFDHQGGGTMGEPNVPNVTIGGLAYDPAEPDHLYVGLNTAFRDSSAPPAGAVDRSSDGGATWAPLGRRDLGVVHDLTLGIDGRTLYVATEQGVWQMPLPRPTGASGG